MRKQVELLKHHPDIAPDLAGGSVVQLGTINADRALFVGLQPIDATDQSGLAGPGRTANHDLLAFCYIQRDVVQRSERPEGFRDPLDPDNWLLGLPHGPDPWQKSAGLPTLFLPIDAKNATWCGQFNRETQTCSN